MIVDPWGTVVAECSASGKPEIAVTEISLDFLNELREKMPVKMHREAARMKTREGVVVCQ